MSKAATALATELATQERSASWLARQVGISHMAASRYARGVRVPDKVTQRAIAKALGVSMAKLFGPNGTR